MCLHAKKMDRELTPTDFFEVETLPDRPESLEPYYTQHKGRNRFFCGGHCVMSRQLGLFYFTLFLLFGISTLFFAFDCRFLAMSTSPAIGAVGLVVFVFVVAILFRASCSDPGIIPRPTRYELECLEGNCGVSQTPHNNSPAPAVNGLMPPQSVTIRGYLLKQVYCYTCRIYRPPRASHCAICNNCIDRFDHHCPWIGNCVGRRNYRYFVGFILSTTVYCAYVLAFSILNVALFFRKTGDIMETVKSTPASFIEIFISFFSMWSVFFLSIFHVYLSCRDFSTHEDIRGFPRTLRNTRQKNPFAHGNGCTNLVYILCGPTPPSALRAWQKVDPKLWQYTTPPPLAPESTVAARPLQVPTNLINGDWRNSVGGYPRDIRDPLSSPHQISSNVENTKSKPMRKTGPPSRRAVLSGEVEEDGETAPKTSVAGRKVAAVFPSSPISPNHPGPGISDLTSSISQPDY